MLLSLGKSILGLVLTVFVANCPEELVHQLVDTHFDGILARL